MSFQNRDAPRLDYSSPDIVLYLNATQDAGLQCFTKYLQTRRVLDPNSPRLFRNRIFARFSSSISAVSVVTNQVLSPRPLPAVLLRVAPSGTATEYDPPRKRLVHLGSADSAPFACVHTPQLSRPAINWVTAAASPMPSNHTP